MEARVTRDHRRLAAIVSLDVAGYSRLMGVDDSGTLAALKAHRREVIDPTIAEHNGRIVKTTGDGLLLEFPSVVDAVRCAVDVQRGMARRNEGTAPDRRLDFRIGINVGDIIIDGDDIFGDGVNVAARLEALADPGGICVSRVVRDQVLDKLTFTFEDLGARQVKNIARPVDVYRVDLGTLGQQARGPGRKRWQHFARMPRWRWSATAILALGVVGIGLWGLPQWFHSATPSGPLTGSLAVLPFTASAASPADEPLADAVTADLTSMLQRGMPWAPVVSPNLVLAYKGKTNDARLLGRELRTRYVVEGDVRTIGDQIVVRARLTNTASGTQLWSGDVGLDRARAAKDPGELVARLAVQVKSALIDAETRRVLAQPIANASAMDLTIRADALVQMDAVGSLTTLAETRKLYDAALRLDPNLPEALMGRALTVSGRLELDPRTDHDALVREYEELSARLVAAAGNTARAWNIRADALQRAWRWEAALEANARARSIDPTRTGSIGQRADIMNAMGRPDEALTLVDQGLSLQPPDAGATAYLIGSRCRAYVALGRHEDAIAACEKEASLADSWVPHAYLAAAYAQLGSDAKAKAEKAKLLALRPDFSVADFKAFRFSDVPAYLQQTETHLFAGLRKAGVKEN
jgi:adenylate cyclase